MDLVGRSFGARGDRLSDTVLKEQRERNGECVCGVVHIYMISSSSGAFRLLVANIVTYESAIVDVGLQYYRYSILFMCDS